MMEVVMAATLTLTCYVPEFLYCTGLTVAVGLLLFNNVLLIIVLNNNYN